MKHATAIALDALEGLLEEIRTLGLLTERKRGVFYRKSAAFAHFHEDPAGFFADVRTGPTWTRLRVTTPREQRTLVATIKRWA